MSEQHTASSNDYSFGASRRSLNEWTEHFRNPTLTTLPRSLEECVLFVDLFGVAFDDSAGKADVLARVREALRTLNDNVRLAEQAVADSQRRPLPARPKARERILADRAEKREQVAIAQSMLEIAMGCASRFNYNVALVDA